MMGFELEEKHNPSRPRAGEVTGTDPHPKGGV